MFTRIAFLYKIELNYWFYLLTSRLLWYKRSSSWTSVPNRKEIRQERQQERQGRAAYSCTDKGGHTGHNRKEEYPRELWRSKSWNVIRTAVNMWLMVSYSQWLSFDFPCQCSQCPCLHWLTLPYSQWLNFDSPSHNAVSGRLFSE